MSASSDEAAPHLLKYNRVPVVPADDAVSTIAIHGGLVVVGTRGGAVHVADRHGRPAQPPRAAHAPVDGVGVTGLSIDAAGAHVASCGADGTVVVASLVPSASKTKQAPQSKTGPGADTDTDVETFEYVGKRALLPPPLLLLLLRGRCRCHRSCCCC